MIIQKFWFMTQKVDREGDTNTKSTELGFCSEPMTQGMNIDKPKSKMAFWILTQTKIENGVLDYDPNQNRKWRFGF
jgi:hypothetical protein